MSGGHFDFEQHNITNGLEQFNSNSDVKRRFPQLAKKLKDLEDNLRKILHDIDWDFSGDSSIDDDSKFDEESVSKLS